MTDLLKEVRRRYNLRVYALILNKENEILLSDEKYADRSFTKFPGGGLEWGEGLKDGLKRELKEELSIDADIGDLFYVNDFFQRSAFRKTDQLISFYFVVRVNRSDLKHVTNSEKPLSDKEDRVYWLDAKSIHPGLLTFPVDKVVAEKLMRHDFSA